MRTQVCIIGGGPSGLLLSQLLHLAGIDTVILEKKTREYVLSRIRAGVLEWGSVQMLEKAEVGERMHKEGFPHSGCYLAVQNRGFRIDFEKRTGKKVMIYGQTEVTHDLYDARDRMEGVVIHEALDVMPHDIETDSPYVTYKKDGAECRIDCDWVAGCDGYHGVSRSCLPNGLQKVYEKEYPFGWLGILSETPPAADELIYANHPRGFALCSMRNKNLSRYYVQAPIDTDLDDWPDERFWDELKRRIPEQTADTIITGPSIEKSIAPLRSFVSEPMRHGRLCLCGDAAHIVPPTGAKGLNLAISDVHYLHNALIAWYEGDKQKIETYSNDALRRVWKAIRFSWWFTTTWHRFPDQTDFDQKIQEAEIQTLEDSEYARAKMAEQYVGAPY